MVLRRVLPLIAGCMILVSAFLYSDDNITNEGPEAAASVNLMGFVYEYFAVNVETRINHCLGISVPLGYAYYRNTSGLYHFGELGCGLRYYFLGADLSAEATALSGLWIGAAGKGRVWATGGSYYMLSASIEAGYKRVIGKNSSKGIYLEPWAGYQKILYNTYPLRDRRFEGFEYGVGLGYSF